MPQVDLVERVANPFMLGFRVVSTLGVEMVLLVDLDRAFENLVTQDLELFYQLTLGCFSSLV